jgi:hypothetical protein
MCMARDITFARRVERSRMLSRLCEREAQAALANGSFSLNSVISFLC